MVLSRPDILKYLEEKKLRFKPEVEKDDIAQVSIDLRLGRKFTTFKKEIGYISSIQVDPSLWDSADLWNTVEQEQFILRPGEFVLAQTLEQVYIPPDLVGMVEGRSSFARIGVTVHVTAPKIDPGFDATITLEMANFGSMPVTLRAEVDKPAQLILMKLSTPLPQSQLYGTRETDHFQYQKDPIPKKQ